MKIKLNEIETFSWDIVEDAVDQGQSEEIADILNEGLKAKGELETASHHISMLKAEMARTKKELASILAMLTEWRDQEPDKATELKLERTLSK